MSSEFKDMKASGGPFEPGETVANKLWKVLQFLFFPPLLLRWWHTDRNMGVGDMYVYRGELTLCDCKSDDAFVDGTENVKSKPESDLLYLHQHVNDLAASERELHEPQHVPVDQGGGNQPLPLHEPDDQGDVVQVEPLYEPDDDKEHSVNDLIALNPVSVIDLQLLPQYDQGGGDVHHDIVENQVYGVDRM